MEDQWRYWNSQEPSTHPINNLPTQPNTFSYYGASNQYSYDSPIHYLSIEEPLENQTQWAPTEGYGCQTCGNYGHVAADCHMATPQQNTWVEHMNYQGNSWDDTYAHTYNSEWQYHPDTQWQPQYINPPPQAKTSLELLLERFVEACRENSENLKESCRMMFENLDTKMTAGIFTDRDPEELPLIFEPETVEVKEEPKESLETTETMDENVQEIIITPLPPCEPLALVIKQSIEFLYKDFHESIQESIFKTPQPPEDIYILDVIETSDVLEEHLLASLFTEPEDFSDTKRKAEVIKSDNTTTTRMRKKRKKLKCVRHFVKLELWIPKMLGGVSPPRWDPP